MAYPASPHLPMIDADYDRDCPRCGSDTYTTSGNGTRYCEDPDCPWAVIKGTIV